MSALQDFIDEVGPVEFARRCGVSYQVVQYWRKATPKPKYWAVIERASDGKVTHTDLLAGLQHAA